jgi:hypothetical protein
VGFLLSDRPSDRGRGVHDRVNRSVREGVKRTPSHHALSALVAPKCIAFLLIESSAASRRDRTGAGDHVIEILLLDPTCERGARPPRAVRNVPSTSRARSISTGVRLPRRRSGKEK